MIKPGGPQALGGVKASLHKVLEGRLRRLRPPQGPRRRVIGEKANAGAA